MNYNYKCFFYNKEDDFRIFKTDNINYFAHLHRQFEIIYLLSGELTVEINDVSYYLLSGDMAIISPNQIHSYVSKSDNQLYIMIFESQIATAFSKLFKNKKLENPVIKVSEHTNYLRYLFENTDSASERKDNSLIISGYVHLILGTILKYLTFCKNKKFESSTLQNVLMYVQDNYDKKITLDILARETGVSRYYISRIFNNKIGISFSDYLKAIRIDKATRLLSTDMTIIQVALESGFENIRSFYRAFNDVHKISPKGFRDERTPLMPF